MKNSFLYSFISPVTGRVWSERDYVLYGDKAGVAMPSPILMDVRLDILDIKKKLKHIKPFPSDIGYIITKADARLPNAQALRDLSKGLMFNNNGIISTKKTINIDELPELNTTDVPTPLGNFVGQVWEGTSSGRPIASSIVGEMFADIELINGRFLTGEFIMGDATVQTAWPKSQFLVNLADGLLAKTGKKLESAKLTHNKIWKGDAENKPIEADIEIAPTDAKYILQQPSGGLEQAQSLSELGTGILKSTTATGVISIASGGKTPEVNDYVRPIDLQEEIEEVITEATEAGATAGGEAGATAGAAAGATAGAEAGGTAGATAGTAAGTAAATLVLATKESKSDHNSDIARVDKRIDELGDSKEDKTSHKIDIDNINKIIEQIKNAKIKPERIEGFPNDKLLYLAGDGSWQDPINHQTLLLEYKQNKCSMTAMDNRLETTGGFVRNALPSSIIEASYNKESASIVMNSEYIQLVQNFDNMGIMFSDSDIDTFYHYQSYVSSQGSLIVNSSQDSFYSFKQKQQANYLDKLNQIKVYDYAEKAWFDDKDTTEQKTRKYYKCKQHSMGIIGEQLVKIFPDSTDRFDVIKFDETNKKDIPEKVWNYKPNIDEKKYRDKKNNQKFGQIGINYNNLLCYTILAVQELAQKLEHMEKEVHELKTNYMF